MNFLFNTSLRRRFVAMTIVGVATLSAAGVATYHRFDSTQATGSGGATTFVQSSAQGSALQGEVAANANTTIKFPFGVLGEYDASSSTFGVGVIGISGTGYAVAAEAVGKNPSMLAYSTGSNTALAASVTKGSSGDAIDAVADSGPGLNVASNTNSAVLGTNT